MHCVATADCTHRHERAAAGASDEQQEACAWDGLPNGLRALIGHDMQPATPLSIKGRKQPPPHASAPLPNRDHVRHVRRVRPVQTRTKPPTAPPGAWASSLVTPTVPARCASLARSRGRRSHRVVLIFLPRPTALGFTRARARVRTATRHTRTRRLVRGLAVKVDEIEHLTKVAARDQPVSEVCLQRALDLLLAVSACKVRVSVSFRLQVHSYHSFFFSRWTCKYTAQ